MFHLVIWVLSSTWAYGIPACWTVFRQLMLLIIKWKLQLQMRIFSRSLKVCSLGTQNGAKHNV
jgi:hypothetical protein